jgi:hypothetical protein
MELISAAQETATLENVTLTSGAHQPAANAELCSLATTHVLGHSLVIVVRSTDTVVAPTTTAVPLTVTLGLV